MSTVPLYHRRLGSPEGAPVVILHGLLGSSDNWGSVGKELAEPNDPQAEKLDVVLVDLRDHGRSPHTDGTSYPLMAADVHALVEQLGLKDIILVGHSMGGKAAMAFAQQWPELLSRLVVVDIGAREYRSTHDQILKALATADLSPGTTRKQVEEHVASFVPEPGVVQFLMKNLYWNEHQQLAWRVNVPVIQRDLPKILAAIGPEVVKVPTLFIRGGQSDYIQREDIPALKEQFPNSTVETVGFAGHWVHAQAPGEVTAMIRGEQ
jgi:esterase